MPNHTPGSTLPEFARLTAGEKEIVDQIVDRAVVMYAVAGYPRAAIQIRMDVEAVHARVPLRLQELLEADDFNFAHDIGGIARHLDRRTGLLTNHFLPRFAKSDTPEVPS